MQENTLSKENIEFLLGKLLCERNLTISTAESCTGGMVAAKLISYPGISSVFLEGAVTYSNESKMKRLGVKKETLDKCGAVSKETAEEMARGIALESGSKVSIATTGIAGPGGGTSEKPVGLVYIGVYLGEKTVVKKCNFDGDREIVRQSATIMALKLLMDEIIK